MDGQILQSVKKERSKKMLQTVCALKESYMKSYIGKTLNVLFEQKRNGYFEGTSENYIKVVTETNKDLTGKIIKIKITDFCNDFLKGE